jgi:putative transposase
MTAATKLAPTVGLVAACAALGIARATVYRRRRPPAAAPVRRPSPRALQPGEQQAVLDTLHEPRFVDQAPREVYATLLDEERYLCSVRTMYRLLSAHDEVRERRDQLRHPHYTKPELLATRPNQVWSWDITKLLGPAKWTYYYLYVILDIFSRYVVGWMVAHRESNQLAQQLIAGTCAKEHIVPGRLTIHADRGTSMKSKPVALLLADLGVTKTHSRPHVSNDNPFSESQFHTLKYRPEFPDRFGSIQDARAFGGPFFRWYNHEHHHTGLGLLTPADVHLGRTAGVLARRQLVLSAAWLQHPERFVRRPPVPQAPPEAVWINPPPRSAEALPEANAAPAPDESLEESQ